MMDRRPSRSPFRRSGRPICVYTAVHASRRKAKLLRSFRLICWQTCAIKAVKQLDKELRPKC